MLTVYTGVSVCSWRLDCNVCWCLKWSYLFQLLNWHCTCWEWCLLLINTRSHQNLPQDKAKLRHDLSKQLAITVWSVTQPDTVRSNVPCTPTRPSDVGSDRRGCHTHPARGNRDIPARHRAPPRHCHHDRRCCTRHQQPYTYWTEGILRGTRGTHWLTNTLFHIQLFLYLCLDSDPRCLFSKNHVSLHSSLSTLQLSMKDAKFPK